MRTILSGTLAALGVLALAMPAHAGSLLVPPSVYYGTGNTANTDWTIDNSNGIELGLEALIRYTASVTPTTGNIYDVGLGDTTVALKQGSKWGFAFSANSTSGLLSQYTLSLSVTDYIHGTTVALDPSLAVILDDAAYDGNALHTTNNCFASPTLACNPANTLAIQNAEALSFTSGVGSFLDPAYNSHVDDTFLITLSAVGPGGTSSTSILVNAGAGAPLPEPASMALLGSGLLGLGALRRRRRG